MSECNFYLTGESAALRYAADILTSNGYALLPSPSQNITHLLLPVPSFDPSGQIKGGIDLKALLSKLPDDVMVIGGNLEHSALLDYRTVDLLKDPHYVAENANITAYCAIRQAMNLLPLTLKDCPTLVIGWGRIGKCLARLLRQMDADVTVAARKASDRAALCSLGYRTADTAFLDPTAYRLIFNTAPVMLLPDCPGNAVKIDLASRPGIGSPDTIWARGLPGKDAPESSGRLIAQTVIRLCKRKEQEI